MLASRGFYTFPKPIPVLMSDVGRKAFPMRPHVGLAYSISKDRSAIRVELEPVTGVMWRRGTYHISLWRPSKRRRPRMEKPPRRPPVSDPDRVGGTT